MYFNQQSLIVQRIIIRFPNEYFVDKSQSDINNLAISSFSILIYTSSFLWKTTQGMVTKLIEWRKFISVSLLTWEPASRNRPRDRKHFAFVKYCGIWCLHTPKRPTYIIYKYLSQAQSFNMFHLTHSMWSIFCHSPLFAVRSPTSKTFSGNQACISYARLLSQKSW